MTEEAPESGSRMSKHHHHHDDEDGIHHFLLDVQRSHDGVLICLFVWFEGFVDGLRLL